jgi:hypothetical protein
LAALTPAGTATASVRSGGWTALPRRTGLKVARILVLSLVFLFVLAGTLSYLLGVVLH